ncbi:acetylglutamate kinase [Streptomyces malaysiense]|uniref:Acetylglutamate kinase n=1 Tax=Streptomyces malaysiense TaxID=1428626 RepID=A0A1J4PS70_9ACTN|nr:acetylglutamate kinase [Streptomyces malaysiense]OIK23562.1 acetylglutamate kinase [Streptomyces malaysiense]
MSTLPLASATGRTVDALGEIAVIKLGGSTMVDDDLRRDFVRDVVRLHEAGLRPVVVHGGGPQISDELRRRSIASEFRNGLRVTSEEAMGVVRMVLTGVVQRELVGLINEHRPLAVGITGEDADMLVAARHRPEMDGGPVDIGRVGAVTHVAPQLLESLLADGLIPIVSSIARSAEDAHVYNVNADTVAAAIATALRASKLLLVTDVAGLYADWPHTEDVYERLTAKELERLLPGLSSGMLPKMRGCLEAVRGGVRSAHVVDGRDRDAILTTILTDRSVGTTVLPDPPGAKT